MKRIASVPRSASDFLSAAGLAILLLASTDARSETWPKNTQPLFHIERSLNANIVQYDAVLKPDGSLDEHKPVIGYWIRKAEDGRRRSLSYMERKLAYGFKVRKLGDGSVLLDMAVDIRRNVKVTRIDGRWTALTRIAGTSAVLDRVFVQLADNKKIPKVAYVELYGYDLQTGESVQERIRGH